MPKPDLFIPSPEAFKMSPQQIVFGEERLAADKDDLAYSHSVLDLSFRVAALFEAFAPVVRQGADSVTHRVKDLYDGEQFYVARGLTVATDVRAAADDDPYAPNDYDFAILNFAASKEPMQLPEKPSLINMKPEKACCSGAIMMPLCTALFGVGSLV